MTKAALKKNIHKTIDSLNNESVLQAVYTILNNAVEKENDLPFSLDEYKSRQELSIKQIKEGKVMSHSDIKKRFRIK
jgi:hypothetical protein